MGISWEYHGNIMGISWKYHGNIMEIMSDHGNIMELSWTYPWDMMGIYGYPQRLFNSLPWKPLPSYR